MLVEIGSAGGNKFLNVLWNHPFGLNVYDLRMTGDMGLCVIQREGTMPGTVVIPLQSSELSFMGAV
jgi:hypothetical protein